MKVASYNGCKVYNLSSGKTAPQWMSQSKRRALQKDDEYRRRVELIQDFENNTASQCIAMTRDCEHIILTGTYPPVVKCFTTSDMAMKFQRGLTCEVVAMETLSDDFGKLVFLQSDRSLSFHAPYGTHYSLRVPRFGRDLVYNRENCDLYVGGNGNEIYRLNLESGQFREPFTIGFEGVNKMHINPVHGLLGLAGDGGVCEFWDPRSKNPVSHLTLDNPLGGNMNATEIKFDADGLTMAVGTSNGLVYLYDIRSRSPVYSKEHQYNLPIENITYHASSQTILTADKKVMKIWARSSPDMGKVLTNIETPSEINSLVSVRDQRGETGLLMVAGEQSRVMTYFVPQLGPAPRWCSFLENITEELEEAEGKVYEDFKFVTRAELEDIGGEGLLGGTALKPYMHGFFIDMKVYSKLRAAAKPFEYADYRKQKIREQIAEKRGARIAPLQPKVKVNQELANKLTRKKKAAEDDGEAAAGGLVDDRFKALFEREEFQVDNLSPDYLLHHPHKRSAQDKKAKAADSDDELDIYDEVEEEDEEDDDDDEEDDDGEEHGDSEKSSDEDDEDEEHMSRKKRKQLLQRRGGGEDGEEVGAIMRASLKARQKKGSVAAEKNKGSRMFELAEGFSARDAMFGDEKGMKERRREAKALASVPLQERMRMGGKGGDRRDGGGGSGMGGRGGGRGGGSSFSKAWAELDRGGGRGGSRGGGRGRGGRGGGRGGGGAFKAHGSSMKSKGHGGYRQ